MIEGFLASWDLFAATYLAGWLIAILLAMVGVTVVARGQVFIGAAAAQASTFGIALAMSASAWIGHAISEAALASVLAIVFAVAATVFAARPGSAVRESQEALAAVIFLAGGAGAILLVAHAPHGLTQVQRLMASSIIGASTTDVVIYALLALATAVGIALSHRTLRLLIMDEPTAAVLGVRVGWWNFVMAVWLGLVLGLALRSSGMLYVFGCLVLPALTARRLCRCVWPMFIVAPCAALVASVAGFVIANHYDLPPAQVVVALLLVCLALGRVLHVFR